MSRIELLAPSRLHFGLLSWNQERGREFGGVGLMIDKPGLLLTAEPANSWKASGPLAGRILDVANQVAGKLIEWGSPSPKVSFEVEFAPLEHVGMGVGTQVGLSVARILCELAGRSDPRIEELAELSGRGVRSGIGLHGFVRGGLIVDGGRERSEGIPALISALEFPRDWSVLVVMPGTDHGIHGVREVRAFAELAPSTDQLTDRLCRLVLLGLMPAVVEQSLTRFGEALEAIQDQVGVGFSPVQGGIFSSPVSGKLADFLRSLGLHGVGQSSWGPTIYGFYEGTIDEKNEILSLIRSRFGVAVREVFWTSASSKGHTLKKS